MWLTLATWFRRLADWCDPPAGPTPLLLHAATVVRHLAADVHPRLEGRDPKAMAAWRRRRAVQALRAAHPDARMRDLHLAIEQAVAELP